MHRFLVGHAAHADWRQALAQAAAQIDAAARAHERSDAGPLTLGFAYFTDHHAAQAAPLLAALQARWPGVAWVGCVGVGVAAMGTEYIDTPALALMLAALPAGRFEVFSGAHKLQRIAPWSALVHADPATPDLPELIAEMSDRVASGYLFGGLASSRGPTCHLADGLWRGGLSGVAFAREVAIVSRVTQGSQPLGPARRITACDGHVVLELDGAPALPLLLRDIGLADLDDRAQVLPRLRATLAGITDAEGDEPAAGEAGARRLHRTFGPDVRVRHLVGLDPARQAVAIAERVQPGQRLAFCQRDVQAARRDLVRICSEIREELAPEHEGLPVPAGAAAAPEPARRILGAVYISCAGRGGPHFGGPSAELQIVQHALGASDGDEVPLVGFFAGGEIGHHHLYGYTGVLTVFTGRA